MNSKGWIKLHRSITDHWIWKDPTKLKWWLDLILMVNHEDSKVNLKMSIYDCKRGEKITSLKHLSERWGVGKTTVYRFLQLLESESMIELKSGTQKTSITICNYDSYQESDSFYGTLEERKRNARGTLEDTNNNIRIKELKNNKKNSNENTLESKEKIAASVDATQTRSKKFYNSLIPFLELYPPEMIRAFYDYWSEPNKSQTKMRFELERTWDVKRRLNYWSSREKIKKATYGKTAKQNCTDRKESVERLTELAERVLAGNGG